MQTGRRSVFWSGGARRIKALLDLCLDARSIAALLLVLAQQPLLLV